MDDDNDGLQRRRSRWVAVSAMAAVLSATAALVTALAGLWHPPIPFPVITINAKVVGASPSSAPPRTVVPPTVISPGTTQVETPPSLSADIAGTWSGLLTEASGGSASVYNYSIMITKSGGILYGRATIKETPPNDTYYATFDVIGHPQSDGLFDLQEQQVVQQNQVPGYSWCVMDLTVELSGSNLSGTWTAPGCAGGKVDLSRSS